MNTSVDQRYIWLNGEILHVQDAKINVLSPTAQFGLNVFEGIRCYWTGEQLFAFRLEDHFKRLKRSQKLLQMDDSFTTEELTRAFLEVIRANEYQEDIAVRQTLFVEGFGSWASTGPVGMFVAPIPKGKTSAEYNKKGLRCCVSSWQRINDNSLSPRIKCGANYMNSRMGQLEALKNGYDTTIFLNNHGTVSEGPGSCLFIVKDGSLITPLVTDSVLESITRDTILRLAREVLCLHVEERQIDRTELYMADEAFLCGSAMEITSVISVDQYELSDGITGEVTRRLHQAYLDTVSGRLTAYKRWLMPVY